MGPVWKGFVEHVRSSIADYGEAFDAEIIGRGGLNGLQRLQTQAGRIGFSAGYWAEAQTYEPDPVVSAMLSEHPDVQWWFRPVNDEQIVIDSPHPEWLVNDGGGWWVEPHGYPTLCQSVRGTGKVVREFCADAHSGRPAAVQQLSHQYSGSRRYTITTPDDWMHLVDLHPIRRRIFRSYEFQRLEEIWIPDWRSAASDFDVITLTVGGFAHTAYAPLITPQGRSTMLCGWNPGESVVLNPWWTR